MHIGKPLHDVILLQHRSLEMEGMRMCSLVRTESGTVQCHRWEGIAGCDASLHILEWRIVAAGTERDGRRTAAAADVAAGWKVPGQRT